MSRPRAGPSGGAVRERVSVSDRMGSIAGTRSIAEAHKTRRAVDPGIQLWVLCQDRAAE